MIKQTDLCVMFVVLLHQFHTLFGVGNQVLQFDAGFHRHIAYDRFTRSEETTWATEKKLISSLESRFLIDFEIQIFPISYLSVCLSVDRNFNSNRMNGIKLFQKLFTLQMVRPSVCSVAPFQYNVNLFSLFEF